MKETIGRIHFSYLAPEQLSGILIIVDTPGLQVQLYITIQRIPKVNFDALVKSLQTVIPAKAGIQNLSKSLDSVSSTE